MITDFEAKLNREQQNGHRKVDSAAAKSLTVAPFETLGLDDIEHMPDVKYLISGLLQEGTFSLFYCEAGIGKTFTALDIAFHVAYGMPWFGLNVEQGNVLYIYAEGASGMKKRIQAWHLGNGVEERTSGIRFIGLPVHLIEEADRLKATVESIEQELGQILLVVVDTWAACSGGVERNSNTAVAETFQVAQELTNGTRRHVLFTHHTNKGLDFSGAQAFKDVPQTVIELKQEHANSPIVLTPKKTREEDKEGFVLQLERSVVEVGRTANGEPITSCYIVQSKKPTEQEAKKSRFLEDVDSILSLLKDQGPLGKTELAKQAHTVFNISAERCKRACDWLKKNDRLHIYETRKNNRVLYLLPGQEKVIETVTKFGKPVYGKNWREE